LILPVVLYPCETLSIILRDRTGGWVQSAEGNIWS